MGWGKRGHQTAVRCTAAAVALSAATFGSELRVLPQQAPHVMCGSPRNWGFARRTAGDTKCCAHRTDHHLNHLDTIYTPLRHCAGSVGCRSNQGNMCYTAARRSYADHAAPARQREPENTNQEYICP